MNNIENEQILNSAYKKALEQKLNGYLKSKVPYYWFRSQYLRYWSL